MEVPTHLIRKEHLRLAYKDPQAPILLSFAGSEWIKTAQSPLRGHHVPGTKERKSRCPVTQIIAAMGSFTVPKASRMRLT
jgi:hypothetical protein